MGKTSQATPSESWWSRFWRGLRDFEEALDTSAMDILDHRISVLERELVEIKANQSRNAGDPDDARHLA